MSTAKSEEAATTKSEASEKKDDLVTEANGIRYVSYGTEKESPYLPAIRQLISKDLSEPYSIYVYRYFLYQWPELCFMVLLTHAHRIHTQANPNLRPLTTKTTSSAS